MQTTTYGFGIIYIAQNNSMTARETKTIIVHLLTVFLQSIFFWRNAFFFDYADVSNVVVDQYYYFYKRQNIVFCNHCGIVYVYFMHARTVHRQKWRGIEDSRKKQRIFCNETP